MNFLQIASEKAVGSSGVFGEAADFLARQCFPRIFYIFNLVRVNTIAIS